MPIVSSFLCVCSLCWILSICPLDLLCTRFLALCSGKLTCMNHISGFMNGPFGFQLSLFWGEPEEELGGSEEEGGGGRGRQRVISEYLSLWLLP